MVNGETVPHNGGGSQKSISLLAGQAVPDWLFPRLHMLNMSRIFPAEY